jgi:acyl-CoA synthetase (AMP-forming)/AMP-acid ligase II
MAENVFAVTTSSDVCQPARRRLDRKTWHHEHRSVASDAADAVTHVSSGLVVADCQLHIVDDQGAPLPAGSAGRVLIRSPFLFSGYFRRDDLNASLFDDDGFYDTGDLGYIDEQGHVYITGRMKDLVIIGGKNVYPQDVEQVVNEVPGVHAGRVVSFGVAMRGLGTEGLVVLVESDEPGEAWPEIGERIRRAVPGRLDIDVVDARVVERGKLRKSTSGKLARGGNREWYLGGVFGLVSETISLDD